jgi:hypothetical protein
VLREPHRERTVGDRAVECLEVVANDGVQGRELGPLPAVALGMPERSKLWGSLRWASARISTPFPPAGEADPFKH